MDRNSNLLHFLLTIQIIVIFTSSCDNNSEADFPLVSVNVEINIMVDPEFMPLLSPATSMDVIYHPNGALSLGYDNNGIIIYNNGDGFFAFDRTCPHDLPASIALESDGSMATCPECGSVYILPSEGIPSQGSVSKHLLKQYRTSYYSNGTLRIFN